MTFAFYATLSFFVVLCLLFVGLILIQKGRGGGISSAFGGAGGNTAFGSKTGDVLTWATSVVFAIFLIMCVGLNLMANDLNRSSTTTLQGAPAAQSGQTDLPAVAPTTGPSTPIEPATTAPGAIANPTSMPSN